MSGFGSSFGGNSGGASGWDIDDVFAGAGGGGGKDKDWGPRKFWMPSGASKRIMFLDGSPFALWEHSLYSLNKSKDNAICLKKNGLDEGKGCPLCEAELWPSFIGYFSVIDMGDVTRRPDGSVKLTGFTGKTGKLYQFQKSLLGAKRGGQDKPGVLKKLQRLAGKHGNDLTGTVWDIYRSGAKVESVGDEWEFVEKIAPKDFAPYLVTAGAVEAGLDVKPYDYTAIFKQPAYEDLKRLVGDKGGAAGGSPFADDADY